MIDTAPLFIELRHLLAKSQENITRQLVLGPTLEKALTELAKLRKACEQNDALRASGVTGGAKGGQFMPEDKEAAREAVRMGLRAMTGRWNNKSQKFEDIPDVKLRVETAKFFAAYDEGMPIQRQIVLEMGHKDRETELIEIAGTPSGKKMLLSIGLITPEWLAKNLPDSQEREVKALVEHTPTARKP